MANLERWQVDILQIVNSNVPFIVEAGRVSGQWRGFAPEIILSDLRLGFVSSGENTLELSEGRVTVDVLQLAQRLSAINPCSFCRFKSQR